MKPPFAFFNTLRLAALGAGAALALSACSLGIRTIVQSPPQPTPSAQPAPETSAATPAAEARPAVTLRYAQAFTVEQRAGYMLVTVLKPWRGAGQVFRYALIPRGAPVPADAGDALVIETPVERIVAVNTTHLPYLDRLGVVDRLVGVGDPRRINTPSVVARIKAEQIASVGRNTDLDVERVIDLQPDIVTTLGLGNPEKDNYPVLLQAGLKPVLIADFMEDSPLGRAEWIKFMALFFNREAQAETLFDEVVARYERMASIARNVAQRPTVFMGFDDDGKWHMPGAKSYLARYVLDAGGDYLWSDLDSNSRVPLSFEAVLERAAEADIWLNQSQSWTTLEQVTQADERYSKFRAVREGRVFNNNARLNPTGGNDYNESGHANPDIVLADLIAILHPELLPDHTPFYYHRLK